MFLVYWTVSNKAVIYGDKIILTCKTGHVLTDRVECPVRQWYGGHKDKLLLYNKVSRDVTKYEDRTNVSSTEFSIWQNQPVFLICIHRHFFTMASMRWSISMDIFQKIAILEIIEFLVNLRRTKIYPYTVFSSIPKFRFTLK